jgi:penicillin V acylase-like amidase (Ntn superfamily)
MMRRRSRLVGVAACALLLCGLGDAARACTTFTLRARQGVFFGKNYDFVIGDGFLVTNKRGVAKTAALDRSGETPARWVSRYGSLTFNQFGREFPSGGMNEAGLVIELMWLDGTTYPPPDRRPAVSVLGWIQHMLDTCATTQDVIDRAGEVRIAGGVPLHYLVADASGATATIEFIDGKLVCHEGDRLPVPVLTNDTYASSVGYLKAHAGFGGSRAPRGGPASLDRFCRASAKVKAFGTSGASPVDYAFGILGDVAQARFTRWSIVYDVASRTVYYRTLERPAVKKVPLGAFDLSCATPVRVLDLAAEGEGDMSAGFVPYTREANRDLIGRSFGGVDFLQGVPVPQLDAYARFPDASVCQ